ncbi:unnamed protein product [Heterobilharzia americana]|nr:unnamed protein product [Heterobilharzia americana]
MTLQQCAPKSRLPGIKPRNFRFHDQHITTGSESNGPYFQLLSVHKKSQPSPNVIVEYLSSWPPGSLQNENQLEINKSLQTPKYFQGNHYMRS